MKVKVRRRKPAPKEQEQAKKKRSSIFDEYRTIRIIRKEIAVFGVPYQVIYDDYKSTTSKRSS